MTVGTGASTLRHLPDLPFVVDPQAFAQRTRRNIRSRARIAHPGAGGSFTSKLPQTGVLSRIRLTFLGQVVIAAPAVIAWDEWPYGLIERLRLNLNGSNELWSIPGTALHAHRLIRYPAYEDAVDVFPGTLGGGGASTSAATYPLYLTYDVTLPVDTQWLGAALFAQSSAIDIDLRVDTAPGSDLPGTITGNWVVEPWHHEVPYAEDGSLIVPDVGRLHGVNEVSKTFTGAGDVEIPLIRSAGQLHRLMVQARKGTGNSDRLSAHPATTAARTIRAARLEYAGNQTPYILDPLSSLVATNNEHYGAPLPYDWLCLDLVRENTVRDPIELQGVTDLRLILTMDPAVAAAAGTVSVVQETLF